MMNDFADKLIAWYEVNKRDLPWRNTKDPYQIWISEIILQQTRVVQGYDYFVRFMQRFPNVMTLAEADEDEVMKYWQGLGYYSRARNLHAAAKYMVEQGGFPKTYEGVLALKGVGDYTAAAICSFAYDMPYAVVDGNVYRVLSRWLGIDTPIDTTSGKKQFALLAEELLDKSRPAIYNQAIMDFGALQCTHASPDCLLCPLMDNCIAYLQGRVDELPIKLHRTKIRKRFFNYIYVRTGNYTFIRKRMGNDIWRNLYEPLLLEMELDFSDSLSGIVRQLQEMLGSRTDMFLRPIKMGVKHVLSHQIIYTNFYELTLTQPLDVLEGYQKVHHEDLHKFAVSNLVYQFFSLILEPNNQNNIKDVS